MWIWVLLFLLIFFFSIQTKTKRKRIFKCHSKSCSHNFNDDCNLPLVCIYDNVISGVCLYHSEEVHKRFKEIIPNLTNKDMKVLEDIKAIKDIEGFKNFMKKHGV